MIEQPSEKASFISGGVKLEESLSGFIRKQNIFSLETHSYRTLLEQYGEEILSMLKIT